MPKNKVQKLNRLKKVGEELQQWLYFRGRHFVNKDKTKYSRKQKHKDR